MLLLPMTCYVYTVTRLIWFVRFSLDIKIFGLFVGSSPWFPLYVWFLLLVSARSRSLRFRQSKAWISFRNLWWIYYDEYLWHTSGTPVAHQVYTSYPASESTSGLGNQTKLVTTMQLLPRGWTAIEEHSTLNHGGNWSAIYLMEYLMNIVPFQT